MSTSNITNLTNIKELGDGGAGGTRLGKSASELIGFHGATPSDQFAAVSNVSGSLGDTNAAVTSIISLLKEKGLMA